MIALALLVATGLSVVPASASQRSQGWNDEEAERRAVRKAERKAERRSTKRAVRGDDGFIDRSSTQRSGAARIYTPRRDRTYRAPRYSNNTPQRGGYRVYDYRDSNYDPYYNYPNYRRNGYGNNGGYNGSYNGGYYNGYGYQGNSQYYDNRRGDKDPDEVARRAAQQGYYDGFYRGQYDLRQGVRRPNPQGHGAYQFAMNGWDPEWGSALTFQQSYRQYFMQGYQDGYGRRSMNNRYSRRWW